MDYMEEEEEIAVSTEDIREEEVNNACSIISVSLLAAAGVSSYREYCK